jgi:hypothetical protein
MTGQAELPGRFSPEEFISRLPVALLYINHINISKEILIKYRNIVIPAEAGMT